MSSFKQRFRIRSAALAALLILSPWAAMAGPLDSIPLAPKSKIVLEQTLDVPAGTGSGTEIYVAGRARLAFDFAVQPGKQLQLMVLSAEQEQQRDAGQDPTGRPLLQTTIAGVASQSVTVGPGTYHLTVVNNDSQPISAAIRASVRRL